MKRVFKFIFPLFFLLLVGAIFYKSGFIDLRKYPQSTGPKQIALNCNYKGQDIQLQETLYQSVDEYYFSDPRKLRLSYDKFTASDQKDTTIKQLTQKIKTKGAELGLTSDQTMDLATCFVQNIPYDKDKAKVVLSTSPTDRVERISNKEYSDRFPYETLYDNKGICTDKSYLEAAILKEMGYGAALLTFDKEKHMAVGVKTPSGYTSFDTEYSFVETTSPGFKVGQLPTIDEQQGGAKKAELDKISGTQGNELIPEFPDSDFSPPSEIIKIAEGNEYQRVIEITKDINRLKSLIVEINSLNKEVLALKEALKSSENTANGSKEDLARAENDVKTAQNTYKKNPTDSNYAAYNAAYDEYQSIYTSTKNVIESYNAKVNEYNQLISNLNGLIDEYNTLINKE